MTEYQIKNITVNQVEKLEKFQYRLEIAQMGHYKTCNVYLLLHYIVGIPLVIITAIVAMYSPGSSTNNITLGIFSTVLASLQVFIKPSEKAETHRQSAIKYGGIKREIEAFLMIERTEFELDEFLKVLNKKWQAIAEGSPLTPLSIYKWVEKGVNKQRKNR